MDIVALKIFYKLRMLKQKIIFYGRDNPVWSLYLLIKIGTFLTYFWQKKSDKTDVTLF